ncbi:MAG: (Fe-S)-binding protein [Deltaproteobacteria bacterium]|nr:(Fe-S)-binding protein [Deltaproteobacteria bacterium]
MLLSHYRMEFVRPPNPSAQHLRCFAYLDEDISAALPFLNTVVKGFRFSRQPPSLTLKLPGKLVTLTAREIAINMVQDQVEAENLLRWLKDKINEAWAKREAIEPTFEAAAAPRVLDILKLLPQTNCRACGQPTCMVFAVSLSQGEQSLDACGALDQEKQEKLRGYLKDFQIQA